MKNISVIIPTYNGQDFIEEQIESIVCQLIPGDHIICLDDASSDNTVMILNGLAQKHVMLTYFVNLVNKGPNITIFSLLQMVTDELVIFCDQDDIWCSGRMDIVRQCRDGELSVVGYLPFTSDGRQFSPIEPKSIGIMRTFFKPFIPGCMIGGCTKTVKSLYDTGNIKTLYDQYILIKALLSGVVIHIDSNVKVLYRRHSNNVTNIGFAPNGIVRAFARRVDIIEDLLREVFQKHKK
jgi:glycosyltransferase involved in cell wall biosynthesis